MDADKPLHVQVRPSTLWGIAAGTGFAALWVAILIALPTGWSGLWGVLTFFLPYQAGVWVKEGIHERAVRAEVQRRRS